MINVYRINIIFFFWINLTATLLSISNASDIKDKRFKVALVESQGYNEEVWLAFAQALSKLDNVDTSIGLLRKSNDIVQIIEDFSWMKEPQFFSVDEVSSQLLTDRESDVYISTTCDEEVLYRNNFFQALFTKSNVRLFCVIHHANNFKADGERVRNILPWIKARRIRMLTLSEHVAQSLMNQLGPLYGLTSIDFFPPVFSIHPDLLGREEYPTVQRSEKTRKIVLQGTINPDRRNYAGVIKEMKQETNDVKRIKQGGGSLIVLGRGEKIDAGDMSNIYQFSNLTYPEYFSIMAKNDVLLIGNGDRRVLTDEVTSSIAAALISGTPIVADTDFLQAYTYIPPDAVILPRKEQTHLQAAFDYISLPALLHTRKRHAVTTSRKTILLQNKNRLGKWITYIR